MTAAAPEIVSVPRLWPGETFVVVAGGPEAARADLPSMRSRCRVIAVKDAVRLVPWADVLYGSDAKWWRHHKDAGYRGPRFSCDADAAPHAAVLRWTGITGLETDPSGVRTGKNSGYAAINLAVHLGAAKVVLVGFDMKDDRGRHHWFGPHPYATLDPPYMALREIFPTIAQPLRDLGIDVVNATPGSALECFRRATLEEALA